MAELNAGAPRIVDRLCEPCAEHFAAVRAHLDALGVAYRLEPGLVRGLDYYTRTAFEFYRRGAEGQQQALGGGGRYDGLVELLGGRPTPGIGFGLGLDRVVLALEADGAAPAPAPGPVAVVVGADPARHGRPAGGRHRAAGRRAGRPGGARPAQARSAARGGGPRRRPLRGDPRRRAGRRPGPAPRPRGRRPRSSSRSATWPASCVGPRAPTSTADAESRRARRSRTLAAIGRTR